MQSMQRAELVPLAPSDRVHSLACCKKKKKTVRDRTPTWIPSFISQEAVGFLIPRLNVFPPTHLHFALQALSNAPKLLFSTERSLTTSYVGSPLGDLDSPCRNSRMACYLWLSMWHKEGCFLAMQRREGKKSDSRFDLEPRETQLQRERHVQAI